MLRLPMWSLALIVAVAMSGTQTSETSAAQRATPGEDLLSAAKRFQSTLKGVAKTLEKRPSQVEPNRWTSVKAAADELQQKASRLRAAIVAAERSGDQLGIDNGRLQARLDSLASNFEQRAKEAQEQVGDLPEPLASIVKREANVWLAWGKTTEAFRDHYEHLLTQWQTRVAEFRLIDPVLARLEAGAADCAELADIGERLENAAMLHTLADELNAILDAFDWLNDEARAALAQADPKVLTLQPTTLATSSDSTDASRKWTSVSGHTVDARLVRTDGETVRLQRSDNHREIAVRIDRLSEGDREIVRRVAMLTNGLAQN